MSFSQENDLMAHDMPLSPEEFVGTTLELWHSARDFMLAQGKTAGAEEFSIAIKILKGTYNVNELIDLESYDNQMEEYLHADILPRD